MRKKGMNNIDYANLRIRLLEEELTPVAEKALKTNAPKDLRKVLSLRKKIASLTIAKNRLEKNAQQRKDKSHPILPPNPHTRPAPARQEKYTPAEVAELRRKINARRAQWKARAKTQE